MKREWQKNQILGIGNGQPHLSHGLGVFSLIIAFPHSFDLLFLLRWCSPVGVQD